MTSNENWWQEFRSQMPVVDHWAYFDHAAVAPLSALARNALVLWANAVAKHGLANRSRERKNVERLRRLGAQLVGSHPDEIAIVRNTTEGINIVAEAYPWQDGDNVVTLDSEFPSNLYPWMNLASRGVETKLVPTDNERVDLDRVADACDERTRIVSASWIGYATGWRNDVAALAEIAHRNGALFFLDAIQGLGVFPLDVYEAGVDFLAADGHKWLLGPEGAGLMFIRREHLDRLRPLGIGWNSVRQAGDFANVSLDLKPTAARYEGGSYNLCGIAALHASLNALLAWGIEPISARLLQLTDELCTRLDQCGAAIFSCRDDERKSGIVAFELPGADAELVRRHCQGEGVIVNVRNGMLRASPHAYMTTADIDCLIEALNRYQ
jgi:selenocysteine lyase/cysteine desulfurase